MVLGLRFRVMFLGFRLRVLVLGLRFFRFKFRMFGLRVKV